MEADGRRIITCERDQPRCGEIWMCNLAYKDGSVQYGYRPVFILSNDKNNYHSPTLNIIPITSKVRKNKLPVHVELQDYKKSGLQVPSVMFVEQIMTVSKTHLDYCIGKIMDGSVLSNISRAIQIQFPIAAFS